MKLSFSAIIFATFLFLIACQTEPSRNEPAAEETPEALQNSDSYDIIRSVKSRYDDDLVNDLYKELAAKDPELNQLEKELELRAKRKQKLEETFAKYDDKSNRYVSSADRMLATVQDSLLKQKIRNILNANQQQHDAQTAPLSQLITASKDQLKHIEDYHTALKIMKTLPLLAKYQKDYRPEVKPYQDLTKQLDTTLNHIQQKVNQ